MIKKIIRNTAFLLSATFINRILAAIGSIMLINYLGKERYGILSFSAHYSIFFSLILNFGISYIITREVARRKEKSLDFLYGGLILYSVLAAAAYTLLIISFGFFPDIRTVSSIILLIMTSLFLLYVTELFIAVLRAHQKIEYEALIVLSW
ncbi:MAG: oligosaccharide flippase family protein, partial [Actinomycetia bacterium]|nr:oligosaccharide flippase family protein [Actinomycetes bacterium]